MIACNGCTQPSMVGCKNTGGYQPRKEEEVVWCVALGFGKFCPKSLLPSQWRGSFEKVVAKRAPVPLLSHRRHRRDRARRY